MFLNMTKWRVVKGKFKKKWKNGPLPHITIIIVVMTLAILIAYIVPFFQPITYVYNYNDDYQSDYDRTYYYDLMEYTDRIYVHKDGNNTTGDSWESAYTTFNVGYAAVSLDLDDKTIIFVGIGLFDVDCENQLNITKNIHIIGSGRDATVFTNTHASARFVFSVSRYFKIENCEIFINDTYSGIMVYGNNTDANLVHMRFMAGSGAVDIPFMLYLFEGGHGEYEDLHIGGTGSIVIGIFLNGTQHNHFFDVHISRCKSGITFTWITTDENQFSWIMIYKATKGLDIRAGNKQHFMDIHFTDCVNSVDDEVGDSFWINVYTDVMLALVRPDDLNGIVVTTGGAGAYGADVLIYDAALAAVDVSFYVVAIIFEPSSKERYGIRLSLGATIFYTTVCEAKSADEINRLIIETPMIFNSRDKIFCSVMSETGGDTVDVWIEIIWLY